MNKVAVVFSKSNRRFIIIDMDTYEKVFASGLHKDHFNSVQHARKLCTKNDYEIKVLAHV